MNDNPLVSIIIPVFNAEKFLKDTIASAVNQTWAKKEIIIIDDGSTDHSYEIAKSFESETVKIYQQENLGASTARNYGLAKANGAYIQFLDADDFLSPNKIEAQLATLIHHPNFISVCKTVHFFDGQEMNDADTPLEWYAEGSNDPVDFLIKLYGGHLIGPTYGGMIQPNAWLTPKSIIAKAGPWNEALSVDDDGEYFCRILLASAGVKYSFESINFYRKYNTLANLSSQKKHQSNMSLFVATTLKAKHLLSKAPVHKVNLVLSRLFWEVSFSLYANEKRLAQAAMKEAKELAPNYKFVPYRSGLSLWLSKLIGWKAVVKLKFFKNKIQNT